MSDLDTKLALIIEDIMFSEDSPLRNGELTFAEQIKQAFADAGYLKPADKSAYEKALVDSYLKAGGDPDLIVTSRTDWERNAKLAGLMTGQEWYERFEKEIAWMDLPKPWDSIQNGYRDAAKKAAGIE